jgi:hypothetical protein
MTLRPSIVNSVTVLWTSENTDAAVSMLRHTTTAVTQGLALVHSLFTQSVIVYPQSRKHSPHSPPWGLTPVPMHD